MATLLIIHHSPSGSVRKLTDAVVAGAHDDEIEGVDVRVVEALAWARGEADQHDLLDADGYLIITPANFGYMSGALKHVFDSTFLHIGGALSDDGTAADGDSGTGGRPYGMLVHGRYDTEGAVRSIQSVITALGWDQSFEVLSIMGDVTDADLEKAYELGGTLAALLSS